MWRWRRWRRPVEVARTRVDGRLADGDTVLVPGYPRRYAELAAIDARRRGAPGVTAP
jgi:hypothetical protein